MHDTSSHPLLEQVPLTVSPFVHLPRGATLPYRYKTMPSALPPSVVDRPGPSAAANSGSTTPGDPQYQQQHRPAYVTSLPAAGSGSAGMAAHPEDILASCRALSDHLARLQADADAELQRFEDQIRQRELEEKRRVAPGWLDSDERLLVPERLGSAALPPAAAATATASTTSATALPDQDGPSEMSAMTPPPHSQVDMGAELDRAFGSLHLQK